MKKLLLLVVLCCLVAVLGATAGVVSLPAPSAPPLKVAAATVDPQTAIDLGKSYLQQHNIRAARDQFAQAVAAAPDHQEANLLLGMTRVFAVFEENYGTTPGIDSVREIFELSGFSFQTFGIYDIQGTDPADLSPTTPDTGAVLQFVSQRVLTEVDAALGNLAKVTSSSFVSTISPSALERSGDSYQVDYADVLTVKALLNLVKCNLNLLVVYGPDVNIPQVGAAPDQLLTYKQLFADPGFLAPREVTRLGTAREALIAFIDTFNLAALQLQARTQPAHHLFVVDLPVLTGEPVDLSSTTLQEITQALGLVRSSLSGPQLFPGDGPVQDRTIDLSRFFNPADPISIRGSLSNCGSGLALPDPTFKGLFPGGITGRDAFVSRYGAYLLGVACADRSAPLIELSPDYIHFWESPGSSAPDQQVTIHNRGTGPLIVSGMSFAGPNAADFTLSPGSCGSLTPTIQPGASCAVTVATKKPTVNYGYLNGELRVASNDPAKPSDAAQIWGYLQSPQAGVVSGRVKDAVTGEGVQAYVYFYDNHTDSSIFTTTDGAGYYSMAGLMSGSYRILFSSLDSSYVNQWYHNKLNRDSADSVLLTPDSVTLPDAALVKGASVSGTVKEAGSKAPIPYLTVSVHDSQSGAIVASASTSYNGSFTVSRIPAGSYRIRIGNPGGSFAPQWYQQGNAVTLVPSVTLMVGEVLLSPGGSVSGTVRHASTQTGLSGINVIFYNSQTGEFVTSAWTDFGGSYSVGGLSSGSYKVLFSGEQAGYQKLWYNNQASMAAANSITVTAPNSVSGINAALAPVAPTTTTLASQPNPASAGSAVTFTATVAPLSGSVVPTGAVTFRSGQFLLGTATLNASGQASLTTSSLSAGSHAVFAYYVGSSTYNASRSADLIQVISQPQLFTLAVSTSGMGRGSVNSVPTGIACATGETVGCSTTYAGGTVVTLSATPSAYSTFSGWSGACSGTGSCQVTLDASKSVVANFTGDPRLRVEGSSGYFYDLGETLNALTQPGYVLARGMLFTQNVIVDNPVSIWLKGGYLDQSFATRSATSFTTIDGSLKVRRGALRVERLLIR